eukprot:3654856-Pleurochrysis_carterae.AAC.1
MVSFDVAALSAGSSRSADSVRGAKQPLKGRARFESILKTDYLKPRTPEPGVLCRFDHLGILERFLTDFLRSAASYFAHLRGRR